MALSQTTSRDSSKSWVIPLSFTVALLLTVAPYPQWMDFAIPHWVSLVLFYWCLALPERVGVGVGWTLGLIMDLMLHTLFGMHAISMAFVAMVGITMHKRIRLYHLWQQCLVLLLLGVVEIGFVGWVSKLAHGTELKLIYWQAALTTALVWPVVYIILRVLRQRSGIRGGGGLQ